MFFVPIYIFILFFTIVVDYFAGILIENSSGEKKRYYLLLSLFANIGVLALFKYYNFLNTNITHVFSFLHYKNPIPYLKILLPIGLSFHTFQAMSYTIEVYRGNQKAERHFGIYSLYVMFYPQLVAGPIERPQNLLHQFREEHYFDYKRVTNGLKLMAWGLFKKVVIADRLSIMVDYVYKNPHDHFGYPVILATIFFAFQIYCDFSGYSDIAIGSAQVMGFDLMTNFNSPYFSKSISEFWRRWHISLSTWFKDYLYISLGGNRKSKPRWYFNLFITFLISGLWHGANWTFIIWGALHGFYLIFALLTQKVKKNIFTSINLKEHSLINQLYQSLSVFMLVCFAWIFFRASSLNDAFVIIHHSFNLNFDQISLNMLGCNHFELIAGIVSILLLLLIEKNITSPELVTEVNTLRVSVRYPIYILLILFIINFGVFGGNNFIYFQF